MPSSALNITNFTPSWRTILLISVLIRVALILYSEWHDAHSAVKYTDVDYRVFTDAARFVWQTSINTSAAGPFNKWFNVGNPYERATYRYTPLLAVLMTPNIWLHISFGKYLFCVCDIMNGLILRRLLRKHVLPGHYISAKERLEQSTEVHSTSAQIASADTMANLLAAVHLLNPMVFAISTRGSSEAILGLLILLTLERLYEDKWDAAAVLLGISVHWKIYPLIYGVSSVALICRTMRIHQQSSQKTDAIFTHLVPLINYHTVRFFALSATTFLILGIVCYSIWGYPFLYETYLYHIHRRDHRHNFSPYFYLIYLTYPSISETTPLEPLRIWQKILRSPLASFVPQMVPAVGSGLLLGTNKGNLAFTWFVQTVIFVLFNKVCTSQYFLWYLTFLPLILPSLRMSLMRAMLLIGVWVGTQAIWLAEAYKLEFLGENVFLGLWMRSLLYLVGNCWVLVQVMEAYTVA